MSIEKNRKEKLESLDQLFPTNSINRDEKLYLVSFVFPLCKLYLEKGKSIDEELFNTELKNFGNEKLETALSHVEGRISYETKKSLQNQSITRELLISFLCQIESIDELHELYEQILDESASSRVSKDTIAQSFQQKEISSFVEKITKIKLSDKKGMKVYNPFSGLASYSSLTDSEYYGQELDETIWALGTIRLFLQDKQTENYVLEDSLLKWKGFEDFDLIASTPPTGLKLSEEYNDNDGSELLLDSLLDVKFPSIKPLKHHRTFSDLYLSFISETDTASVSILLLDDLQRLSNRLSVKKMIDKDALEMVVSIPETTHRGTGMKSVFLLVNKNKKEKGKITFVDGSSLYTTDSENKNVFLVDELLELIDSVNKKYVSVVENETVAKEDYLLNPARYLFKEPNLPSFASSSIPLSDLVEIRNFSTEENSEAPQLKPEQFSDSPFLDNNNRRSNKSSKSEDKSSNSTLRVCYIDKKDIILRISPSGGCHYAKVSESGIYSVNFLLSHSIKILKIKSTEIFEDYLRWMFQLEYVKIQILLYLRAGASPKISNTDLYKIKIPLCSIKEQTNLVAKYKSRLNKKIKEQLNLKEITADLSHQIGLPKNKIANAIYELNEIFESNKSNLSNEMKRQLAIIKNNFNYINRVIDFNGQPIEKLAEQLVLMKTKTLLEEYIEEWKDVKANVFEIKLDFPQEYNHLIHSNEVLLKIMWDAIFDNTRRHAFPGEKKDNQKLLISIEEASLNDEEYLVFRFSNNGKPLPSSFSTQEFIEKGSHSGDSGNTGQGGTQISDSVHLMGGDIKIESKPDDPNGWTFVLSIYIPTNKNQNNDRK